MRAIATGIAFAALWAATAHAEEAKPEKPGPNPWYVGIEGGWDFVQGNEISSGIPIAVDFEDGWVGGAVVGRRFLDHFRGEVEVAHRRGTLKDATNALWVRGDVRSTAVTGNVYFDLFPEGRVTPFVGAGGGGAQIDPNLEVRFGGGSFIGDDDNYSWLWQAMAGVGVAISHNLTADMSYRYYNAEDYRIGGDFGRRTAEYDGHSVMAGLRYGWGAKTVQAAGGEAVAVAVVPADPVAPVAIPPEFRRVHFDFDRSDITAEAGRILDEVAEIVLGKHASNVLIVAHTDRAGTDEYNLRLSIRRAEAIRKALVHRSVPDEIIDSAAKGESVPLVETEDDVPNAENRRGDIEMTFEEKKAAETAASDKGTGEKEDGEGGN